MFGFKPSPTSQSLVSIRDDISVNRAEYERITKLPPSAEWAIDAIQQTIERKTISIHGAPLQADPAFQTEQVLQRISDGFLTPALASIVEEELCRAVHSSGLDGMSTTEKSAALKKLDQDYTSLSVKEELARRESEEAGFQAWPRAEADPCIVFAVDPAKPDDGLDVDRWFAMRAANESIIEHRHTLSNRLSDLRANPPRAVYEKEEANAQMAQIRAQLEDSADSAQLKQFIEHAEPTMRAAAAKRRAPADPPQKLKRDKIVNQGR